MGSGLWDAPRLRRTHPGHPDLQKHRYLTRNTEVFKKPPQRPDDEANNWADINIGKAWVAGRKSPWCRASVLESLIIEFCANLIEFVYRLKDGFFPSGNAAFLVDHLSLVDPKKTIAWYLALCETRWISRWISQLIFLDLRTFSASRVSVSEIDHLRPVTTLLWRKLRTFQFLSNAQETNFL